MTAPPAAARVAVVIVNYQSYPDLRDCLASLGHADPAITLCVVDHSSRPEPADEIAREFPHIHLLRVPENEGFAAGVNRGARECDAPFVLLLNPDSVADAAMCEALADWMDDHPQVGAAGPRILNADGTVQASARRFPNLTTAIAGRSSWLTRHFPGNPLSRHNLAPSQSPSSAPTEVDWVSGAAMIIRRAAYEAVGGMDEGFFLYWEDADFCRRLKHAGWKTMYVPAVAVRHIGGRSSRHAADASLVAFHRSAFRLFWKHAGPVKRLLAPVVAVALRARLALMRHLVRSGRR
ncbi:MAG: glycosyltransferase family 2 protein [Vicinamibacterales bacterium]